MTEQDASWRPARCRHHHVVLVREGIDLLLDVQGLLLPGDDPLHRGQLMSSMPAVRYLLAAFGRLGLQAVSCIALEVLDGLVGQLRLLDPLRQLVPF